MVAAALEGREALLDFVDGRSHSGVDAVRVPLPCLYEDGATEAEID
jgi:hypothetical protein